MCVICADEWSPSHQHDCQTNRNQQCTVSYLMSQSTQAIIWHFIIKQPQKQKKTQKQPNTLFIFTPKTPYIIKTK